MNNKMVHKRKDNIIIDEKVADKYIKLVTKLDKIKKELEPLEKELSFQLLELMKTMEKSEVYSNGITGKLKEAIVRQVFDTTTFKRDNPDEYMLYLKDSNVKESVKLSI